MKKRYLGISGINLIIAFSNVSIFSRDYNWSSGIYFFADLLGMMAAPFIMVTLSSLWFPFIAYCIYWVLGRDANQKVIFYLFVINSLIFWAILFFGEYHNLTR